MKNIVIIPNKTKDKDLVITRKLIESLYDKANLYMSSQFWGMLEGVVFLDDEKLYTNADCVIVLGGDGTILRVAEPCAKNNIPILGINLGKVGFMAEISIMQINDACTALLSDKYEIENRMMIEVTVLEQSGEKSTYHALNDVVISKAHSSMILLEMYSDNEQLNRYKADGLIIATPTGSTGYSLSAGGPVADPKTEIFIASPICPHELYARPSVLSSGREIILKLTDEMGHSASVSVDGNIKKEITLNDEVVIKKSQFGIGIIKICKQSFYEVLTEKLR